MKILESLVADNEALKRANAENANLLAEVREELRSGTSISFLSRTNGLTSELSPITDAE
jgi:hypothetical protein